MLTLAEAAAADLFDICKVESGFPWGVRIGGAHLYDQFPSQAEAEACRDELRKEAVVAFGDAIYKAHADLVEACEMVVDNYYGGPDGGDEQSCAQACKKALANYRGEVS